MRQAREHGTGRFSLLRRLPYLLLTLLPVLAACGDDEPDKTKPSGQTKGASAPNGAGQGSTHKAGELGGIVRDLEGRPVAGAKVVARLDEFAIASDAFWGNMPRAFFPVVASAMSDAEGRFSMRVEDGPLWAVIATHAGTKSNRARAYANRPFPLTIGAYTPPPGQAGEPERKGEGSISGRVLDAATGKPLAGARLRRAWKDENFTVADAQGRYRVGWTSKIGQPRSGKTDKVLEAVFVFAPGYQIAALPTAAIREGSDTTHDVRMKKGIGVRGRIVDASGKPVQGLRLICEDDILVGDVQYGSVMWTQRSDADGRWSFEEMHAEEPGRAGTGSRYWVRGLTEDGIAVEITDGYFGPDAKESIEIGDVAIGPTSSVTGRVRRVDGKAIEQAPKPGEMPITPKVHYIKYWNKKPARPQIMRNTPWVPITSAGSYRIPKLAPGQYELAFWLSDKLEVEVRTVTIGREPREHRVDVEIGPGRSFRGSVVDSDGKAVDGALLRAWPNHVDEYLPLVPNGNIEHSGRFLQGNVRVLTKPDGTYLLSRIRSKLETLLIVQKEGFQTRKIVVPADAPPPPQIVLERR